jgi:hypothetical protein
MGASLRRLGSKPVHRSLIHQSLAACGKTPIRAGFAKGTTFSRALSRCKWVRVPEVRFSRSRRLFSANRAMSCYETKRFGFFPRLLGAIGRRKRRDGILFRGGRLCGRHLRLRKRLGAFALAVIVAGTARMRLFAVGAKFCAHATPQSMNSPACRSTRRNLDVAPLPPQGAVISVTTGCDDVLVPAARPTHCLSHPRTVAPASRRLLPN